MIIVMRKLICTDGIDFPGASKLYRTAAVARPEQKTETWAVKKAREKSLEITDMRMLQWMCSL